jgi:hypothetical protein
MKTEKTEQIIKYCQDRIRRRMNLSITPDIEVKIRNFEGPDSKGFYKIQPNAWNIIEPSEFWCEAGYFQKVIGQLRNEYPQLYRDTNWRIPLTSVLIEPIISFGSSSMKVTGGINWLVMGVLKNKEKYCAVLDVEVRPLFRKCGLANLMKQTEIEIAGRNNCDFIHTWHWTGNPDFNAAIVPGLKNGFTLYHGKPGDGEMYENRGHVHLRYYFDRIKKRYVQVKTKDGKTFLSPVDNDAIIDYLEASPSQYPGRMIQSVEEYSLAKSKVVRNQNKHMENTKDGQDRQRIFIAEGAAGSEYTRQRNTYRIGDILTFCPVLKIDRFKKSNQHVTYLKHVIYNIYEFCFKVDSLHCVEESDGLTRNDYIMDLLPGLKACYQDWKRQGKFNVNQYYEGYGRLSIGDYRESTGSKPLDYVQNILAKGKLIGIANDLIQKDFSTKYSRQMKQFRYGKHTYCDEDALEWFGYYRCLDEFMLNISGYLKNPVEVESTDSSNDMLIFCIDIIPQSL